jgi:APA family basic amino acid/polyamine antiporter
MWDAAALIVGIIIGSGIFVVPPSITRDLHSFVPIMSVWALGGLLALCGALTYAELTGMFPRTGGAYVFLHETYGAFPSFVYGWSAMLITYPASMAAIAVVFVQYLSHWIPLGAGQQSLVAAALCLALAVLNIIGVKVGADVQRTLTTAKVVAISAIPFFGFLLRKGDLANFTAVAAEPSGSLSLSVLALAMVAVMWTYEGWADAPTIAGEVRDVRRDIPRALMLGAGAVTVIYLAVNAAYIYLLSTDGIVASGSVASDAARAVFGPVGETWVVALVLVSTASSINGACISGSRVLFAMARDGLFFRRVGNVHPRFETPALSVAIVGVLSAAYALLGTFDQLIRYFVFVAMIWFVMNILAVFLLRSRRPDHPRPFRVPFYPITPALFLAAALGLMIQLFRDNTRNSVIGLLLLVVSVPIYFGWRRLQAGKQV